tara:strand:- start:669 stop:788 length:120 start_codon:yes stop_codon:yes gene_type:complete
MKILAILRPFIEEKIILKFLKKNEVKDALGTTYCVILSL